MSKGKPNRRHELEAACAAIRKAREAESPEPSPEEERRALLERAREERVRGKELSGATVANVTAWLEEDGNLEAIIEACFGAKAKPRRKRGS